MLSSARVSALSLMIVALGGTSLLAAPRRAQTCYLVQKVYQGTCASVTVADCTFANLGCPSEAEDFRCTAVSEGEYQLSCCYNGNDVGVCAS